MTNLMIKILFFLAIIAIFGLFFFQGFGVSDFFKQTSNIASLTDLGPGDVFYFLDKSWEWAQVSLFTLSEERKIELKMSFLEERLLELGKLKEKKELTQDKLQKQINNYNNTVSRINDDVEKLKAVKSDVDYLVEKAKIMTEKNKDVIENISQNIPEEAESVVDKVMDFSGNLYQSLLMKWRIWRGDYTM